MTTNTWTDERRAEVQDVANRYHLADLDPESFAEFIEWYKGLSEVEREWLDPTAVLLHYVHCCVRRELREAVKAVEMEAVAFVTFTPSCEWQVTNAVTGPLTVKR